MEIQDTSWHTYPSIFNLGHKYLVDLTNDPVLVEEKIDGSQFSWGLFEDGIKMRSKGIEFTQENAQKMFEPAVTAVYSLLDRLHRGWTYRAEYLSKPKHNVLAYDRIPTNHLIIFDINDGHESYLSYQAKLEEAQRLGLEVVPQLMFGMLTQVEQVHQMLERISILGGSNIEGVVIKNYARFGIDKKALMGKYVSEKFKEIHKAEWKQGNPDSGDICAILIKKYLSEARWNKAIQHLTERGELTSSPKDIGTIMKEVQMDIAKECTEEIQQILFAWVWPRIRSKLVAGLPEWYKNKLLATQFEGNNEPITIDRRENADNKI